MKNIQALSQILTLLNKAESERFETQCKPNEIKR